MNINRCTSLSGKGTPRVQRGILKGKNGGVSHVLSSLSPLLSPCTASLLYSVESGAEYRGIVDGDVMTLPRCFLPSSSPPFPLSVYMVNGDWKRCMEAVHAFFLPHSSQPPQ